MTAIEEVDSEYSFSRFINKIYFAIPAKKVAESSEEGTRNLEPSGDKESEKFLKTLRKLELAPAGQD